MHIKVIQAAHGDCLLVESTSRGRRPTRLLIDGGADDTFPAHLQHVLQGIGGRRILDAVVLSHIDNDHVDGLLDLTRFLESNRANGLGRLVDIRDFWMNQFDVSAPPSDGPPGALFGMVSGTDLARSVDRLGLPLNGKFGGAPILVPDIAAFRLGPLEITVVGPSQEMLDKLREEWLEWLRQRAEIPEGALATWDTSLPNRSSVMLLVRQGSRRALLPGDGRGDHLLSGLELAGLMAPGGSIHVDLFKLPHHGSARNIDPETLDRITADTYVLSANGRHDNPDYQALVWLAESIRRRDGRALLFFTNPTPSLARLLASHPPDEFGYQVEVMSPEEHSRDLEVGGAG